MDSSLFCWYRTARRNLTRQVWSSFACASLQCWQDVVIPAKEGVMLSVCIVISTLFYAVLVLRIFRRVFFFLEEEELAASVA